MNFLLHRHLAARDLGSAAAGVGAMLPDLWRMADRRVRPARELVAAPDGSGELPAVLAGIHHHLELDRWFHSAPVFEEGERITRERLHAARLDAPKVALFAHVTWELCLDGALMRQEGFDRTTHVLREGFGIVNGMLADMAASLHHFERNLRSAAERAAFDAGMQRLFAGIARGPWISGYLSGPGIAERVDGMRIRLGIERFTAVERERFGEAVDELAALAHAGVVEILGSQRA